MIHRDKNRIIKNTCFGDVEVVNDEIVRLCSDNRIWYHLPKAGISNLKIRRFIRQLHEFEQ